MRTTIAIPTMLWAAVFAVFTGAASAEPILHGRVSYADESALIKGADQEEWNFAATNALVLSGDTIWADESGAIEVEFANGVFVRLADGSRIDVMDVPPDALFRGWTGSFYIQRLSRSSGSVVFDTPVGALHIFPDTQVRVDVLEGGSTTVSVRWGEVSVHGEFGDPIDVGAGDRVFIDPGYLPSEPVAFDRGYEDEFDSWNRERARNLALGSTAVGIDPYDDYTLGVQDLNQYGEWIRVDGETYWHPVVVDYVPYRRGYWSYVPAQGYVWVGYYPFSYVTSHHGYWRYHHHHGWLWSYHHHYSPAYAYTIHYGDRFIWAPLGHHGYPVTYSGFVGFTIGDVHFSYGFSSYAYDYHVFHGYHPVHVVHHHHIYDRHHRLRHHNYNYWRIDADGSPYRNSGRPHIPEGRARSYEPTVAARGPRTLDNGRVDARDRAAALASRQGRDQFSPSRPTSRATATRTAARDRSAAVRQARVETSRDRLTNLEARSTRSPSVPRARVQTFRNDDARGVDSIGRGSTSRGDDRSRATSSRPTAPQRPTADGRRELGSRTPSSLDRPTAPTRPDIRRPDATSRNRPTTSRPTPSRPSTTDRDRGVGQTRTERPTEPSLGRPRTSPRPTVERPSSTPRPTVNRPSAPTRTQSDRGLSRTTPTRPTDPSVGRPAPSRSSSPSVSRTSPSRPTISRPSPGPSRTTVSRPSPSPSRSTVSRPSPGPSRSTVSRPSPGPSRSTISRPNPSPSRSTVSRPSPGPSRSTISRPSPSPSRSTVSRPSPSPSRSSVSAPSSSSRNFSSRSTAPSRSAAPRSSGRSSSPRGR